MGFHHSGIRELEFYPERYQTRIFVRDGSLGAHKSHRHPTPGGSWSPVSILYRLISLRTRLIFGVAKLTAMVQILAILDRYVNKSVFTSVAVEPARLASCAFSDGRCWKSPRQSSPRAVAQESKLRIRFRYHGSLGGVGAQDSNICNAASSIQLFLLTFFRFDCPPTSNADPGG